MDSLKPLPYQDALEIMIVETKNEIQKNKILERLAARENMRGNPTTQMMGQLQKKIKMLDQTVLDLEEFLKEELDKAPKA